MSLVVLSALTFAAGLNFCAGLVVGWRAGIAAEQERWGKANFLRNTALHHHVGAIGLVVIGLLLQP